MKTGRFPKVCALGNECNRSEICEDPVSPGFCNCFNLVFFRSELDSKVNRGLVHTHLRTPWVLQGVLGQSGLYIEQLWTLSQKCRNWWLSTLALKTSGFLVCWGHRWLLIWTALHGWCFGSSHKKTFIVKLVGETFKDEILYRWKKNGQVKVSR